MSFFDCSHDLNGILAEARNYDIKTAKEYNAKYDVRLDIQEISHRNRETLEKIDLLSYSKHPAVEMLEISQNLQDVANDVFI